MRAGSWRIRGEQIAATRLEWEALHEVSARDLHRFDLFCMVKRPDEDVVRRLHAARKPVVYDVLDSWGQPAEGLVHDNLSKTREYFRKKWAPFGFHSYVFPDRAMRADLGSLTPHAVVIYHHYNPAIALNPLRLRARTVAYEGDPRYLGPWEGEVRAWCAERDIEFSVNPPSFTNVDIGFAARGGEHDSFMARRYKSNVKLANFYGAGTPCVVSAESAAYHETDNGDVLFFSTRDQMRAQLERLLDYRLRREIRESFLGFRRFFEIGFIADLYERYFLEVFRLFRRGRFVALVGAH